MNDARFEDGGEAPLRLLAQSVEDLSVLSALVQDAVLQSSDLVYDRRRRRLVALVNRFRWEDLPDAARVGRPVERVRAVLVVEDVLAARLSGVNPRRKDEVLSLLALAFEPGSEGAGRLVLTFAGDGAIALDIEALDLRLEDVTKPYLAPSRRAPDHGV
jgi:hypothetical protein